MYIRRTPTRNKATGESYFTHRLVRTERSGDKVRQVTLLNLGRHFPVAQEEWPALCARIEEILTGRAGLLSLTPELEKLAQRYAAQLLLRQGQRVAQTGRAQRAASAQKFLVEVDADSLELLRARSVGVEHAAVSLMRELGFIDYLQALGLTGAQRAAALGNVIGRMAAPGSELATWGWLKNESALGELLDFDFEGMPLMRLYRASDALLRHQPKIEAFLFERICGLFALEATVTLYDLTNTYFEGAAKSNRKAARGHSKEKRSECPLLTLGLVLDASGFIRGSQVFAGNAVEARTLEGMLKDLHAPAGALVVMDRGIATEENLAWCKAHGYRYVVVARAGARQFDPSEAIQISAAGGHKIGLHKVLSADRQEVRLYCHSPGREQKEAAIVARLSKRFEEGLKKLATGLAQPRGEKRLLKITRSASDD